MLDDTHVKFRIKNIDELNELVEVAQERAWRLANELESATYSFNLPKDTMDKIESFDFEIEVD